MRMMFLAALVAAVVGLPAHAQTFPERGRAAVVDAAGVIPAAQERALNDRIAAWVNANGPQLAVVTVPSLEGRDVKDYANRLYRKWGLGQGKSAAQSNGALLLLAPAERKVRIEVGYGLEPVLTDALTSQIIREAIVPKLKAGDAPGALADGADAIMTAATPTAAEPAPLVQRQSRGHGWLWLVFGLMTAGGLIWWILARSAARRREEELAAAQRLAADRARARREELNKAPENFVERPVRHVRPTPPYTPPSPPPPPPPPSPSRSSSRRSSYDSDYGSSSFGLGSGSSSSSSSSYDSGSSSGGYDSGGGSSGGGGSDSSY